MPDGETLDDYVIVWRCWEEDKGTEADPSVSLEADSSLSQREPKRTAESRPYRSGD